MRKVLALTLVVIAFCAVGVGLAATDLHTASRQVVFSNLSEYGDPSVLTDLSVHLRTQYDRHLFWETECEFENGTAQAQTEFSFSELERIENRASIPSGIELQTAISGCVGDLDEPQTGLAAAYQALYAQTPLGEERVQVVYLKDYYTYYPLSVHLDFPDYALMVDPMDTFRADEERQILQAFSDYFRIPVLPDTQMEISVSRDINGKSTGYGMGNFAGDDFYLWMESACTEDACYFTFDPHTAQGNLIDTNEIPDGYGIYRVMTAKNDTDMLAAVQELEMVYALNPENVFLALDITPSNDALLLHTVENGTYMITVIGIENMETLQRLEIMPWPEEYSWKVYVESDFLVVLWPGYSVVLLSRSEDGRFTLEFTAPLGIASDALQNCNTRTALIYNGEKLVFGDFLYQEELYGECCGFYLAVYDGEGLCYYGEYSSSLDDASMLLPYQDRCFPAEADPIAIEFKGERPAKT